MFNKLRDLVRSSQVQYSCYSMVAYVSLVKWLGNRPMSLPADCWYANRNPPSAPIVAAQYMLGIFILGWLAAAKERREIQQRRALERTQATP